jgi:hypothetical protein
MQITSISRKSPLAVAIRYALTRIERLRPYLDHGILELDNNAAERGMRAIALGRKNYLLVGSEAGSKAAAIAYTLIETAKLNSLDPHGWLADTIARIRDSRITKVDELLPWRWNGQRSKRTLTPDDQPPPPRDRSPIFVVAPRRCLAPVGCCLGTKSSQAPKSRASRNVSGGGARNGKAVAISGPIPSTISRQSEIKTGPQPPFYGIPWAGQIWIKGCTKCSVQFSFVQKVKPGMTAAEQVFGAGDQFQCFLEQGCENFTACSP